MDTINSIEKAVCDIEAKLAAARARNADRATIDQLIIDRYRMRLAKTAALQGEQTAAGSLLEKAAPRHSREDQARLDLAHHALVMARGMGGLSKADGEHVDRAITALRSAGAAPWPQGVDAPGPHYRPGVNSVVDSGHRAVPVPGTNSNGSVANVEMMKGAIDKLAILAKRHGGHRALIGAAHDLVAQVAAVCPAMKAGSKHSAVTMGHLTAAHDAMVKAGAICRGGGALGALPPNTAARAGEEEHQGVTEDHAKVAGGNLAKRDKEISAMKATISAARARLEQADETIGGLKSEIATAKAAAELLATPIVLGAGDTRARREGDEAGLALISHALHRKPFSPFYRPAR